MPTDKLDWITEELSTLKEQGLFTTIRTLDSAQGARITIRKSVLGTAMWYCEKLRPLIFAVEALEQVAGLLI